MYMGGKLVLLNWKGDNTILTLQAGRYLIGCYRDAKSGKPQAAGVSYLNRLSSLLHSKCNAVKPIEVANLNVIGEAYNVVSGNIVKKAGEDFEDGLKKGMTEDESYENCCTTYILKNSTNPFIRG